MKLYILKYECCWLNTRQYIIHPINPRLLLSSCCARTFIDISLFSRRATQQLNLTFHLGHVEVASFLDILRIIYNNIYNLYFHIKDAKEHSQIWHVDTLCIYMYVLISDRRHRTNSNMSERPPWRYNFPCEWRGWPWLEKQCKHSLIITIIIMMIIIIIIIWNNIFIIHY